MIFFASRELNAGRSSSSSDSHSTLLGFLANLTRYIGMDQVRIKSACDYCNASMLDHVEAVMSWSFGSILISSCLIRRVLPRWICNGLDRGQGVGSE